MKNKMKPVFTMTALIAVLAFISGVWAGEPKAGNVSGRYTRETDEESARLEVNLLPDGKVHVRGMSLWSTNRKYGPNIGELDFRAPIKNGRVEYSEKTGKGQY